ncbi:MAG: tetratricopeptide repeat protein [candidate division Zixibacteria bacterium]|nr:tetratricopeptide repeat protein [candidate division Zixibacteria bacterium]
MKARFALVGMILVTALLAGNAFSSRLVDFEVTVRERSANDSQYILIEKKLFQIHEGVRTSVFMVNFTLDITANEDDSGDVACQFSLFTLGPQTQTFFKEFKSRPGGIYFLDNVRGKEGAQYRIGIAPLSFSPITAEDECAYDFRSEGTWNFDPSANFDIYFVPRTLGDARWNMLRDFIEISYKDFKQLYQLSFPGKINYFLTPCQLPEVVWDKRMGYAIDPPRSNCFALYGHDFNTVDPFPAYLTRLYRSLGYAPPFLVEGMAGYFEFPHYYAQQLRRSSQLPPVTHLFKSVDYFSLPGVATAATAASFVKYVIDTYGGNRFLELYRLATDLTFRDSFSKIYGKDIAEVEKDWHSLLDTITFPYGQMQYFYERERYIGRETGMNTFMAEMKSRMKTYDDSVFVLSEDGWNQYMKGDFTPAREIYRQLLKLAPNNGSYLLVYGNLFLLDGRYDSARSVYNKTMVVDTTIKTALLKIGESYYWQGKTDSAEVYLTRNVAEDRSQLSQSSAAILLGELSLARGDTAAAVGHYEQALGLMQQLAEMGKSNPPFLMRMGEAHIGLSM